MEGISSIIRRQLQKWSAGRYQWDDHRSIKEILTEISEIDPGAKREIVRGIVSTLVDGADHSEQERAPYIQQVKEKDRVTWLRGVNPGIPVVERRLVEFLERPEWPDVQEAREAVEDWLKHLGPGLLTLSGGPGCGKSHLAIAAAQQLFGEEAAVCYREEPVLMTELQGRISDNTAEEMLQEVLVVPWLIIDDLGVAALGDWGREKMDRLVNARWENSEALRTLITTNLLREQMPVRIASRLGDAKLARAVKVEASDYRPERR